MKRTIATIFIINMTMMIIIYYFISAKRNIVIVFLHVLSMGENSFTFRKNGGDYSSWEITSISLWVWRKVEKRTM